MHHPRSWIEEFLSYRRIALAGASRDEKHFSRAILNEFTSRGYEVVPVNPQAEEIDGLPAAASVAAINPPVEGVMVMTPSDESVKIVREAASAGVKMVWLYRAVAGGSVSRDAVEACDKLGMRVIAGECPCMFFKDAAWFHRLHAGWRTLTGSMPR